MTRISVSLVLGLSLSSVLAACGAALGGRGGVDGHPRGGYFRKHG
jgi:hypothetical protein